MHTIEETTQEKNYISKTNKTNEPEHCPKDGVDEEEKTQGE